jgi:hypothetical protein
LTVAITEGTLSIDMSPTVSPARAIAPPHVPAWSLLQRAQGFLQKWPEGFRGYRAGIRWSAADGAAEGAVVVACGRAPVIELGAPEALRLVRARLLELVDERTPRFFKDGDGRFTVLSEPDVDGERWLRVERPDGTVRYRLDARGRIGAVERVGQGRQTLTLIDEYARATPGRVLPARRRTTTWDARTGACLGREELREAHCRVDHVWLPVSWEVVSESGLLSQAFRVEVFAHQLL